MKESAQPHLTTRDHNAMGTIERRVDSLMGDITDLRRGLETADTMGPRSEHANDYKARGLVALNKIVEAERELRKHLGLSQD